MDIHTYLAAASVDMIGLADYLDHLDAPTRLREVRSLGKREQVKLFEAAADVAPDRPGPLRACGDATAARGGALRTELAGGPARLRETILSARDGQR